MANEQDLTEGTSGAPETAAEGSLSQDQGLGTTDAGVDPKWASAIETIKGMSDEDFKSLMDKSPDLKRRIEAPFLSDFTRKSQQREQEYQQRLQRIENAVSLVEGKLGREATPDERAAIRQRIEEGDLGAIDALLNHALESRVGPIEEQMMAQNAINTAMQMVPEARQFMPQIIEELRGDPQLWKMWEADKHRQGHYILAGLAWKQRALAAEANAKSAAEKAVAEYKAKAAKLPAQTSMAASTAARVPTQSKDLSIDEGMERAWLENVRTS